MVSAPAYLVGHKEHEVISGPDAPFDAIDKA